VIEHLYSSAGGKTANVRVEAVKQSGVIQMRAWGAQSE